MPRTVDADTGQKRIFTMTNVPQYCLKNTSEPTAAVTNKTFTNVVFHSLRFPVGTNNKTKYDPPHRHVCREWHPDVRTRLRDKYEVDIRALDTEMAQAREGVGITGMEQVIATLNKRKNK